MEKKTLETGDAEFEPDIQTSEELLAKWNEGWACMFNAIDSLILEDLDKVIYIRNQGYSIVEAINRQLAHYPYHIGQIVFLGKMLTNHHWTSLSIPKGNSQAYNNDKFFKPKERAHFTDEFLKGFNKI